MRNLVGIIAALLLVALNATVQSNGSFGARASDERPLDVVHVDPAHAGTSDSTARETPAVEPGSLLPPVAVMRPEILTPPSADRSADKVVAVPPSPTYARKLLPHTQQIEVGQAVVSQARRTADLQVYRL